MVVPHFFEPRLHLCSVAAAYRRPEHLPGINYLAWDQRCAVPPIITAQPKNLRIQPAYLDIVFDPTSEHTPGRVGPRRWIYRQSNA